MKNVAAVCKDAWRSGKREPLFIPHIRRESGASGCFAGFVPAARFKKRAKKLFFACHFARNCFDFLHVYSAFEYRFECRLQTNLHFLADGRKMLSPRDDRRAGRLPGDESALPLRVKTIKAKADRPTIRKRLIRHTLISLRR